MNYWLMKSEPGEVSMADLMAMPEQQVEWFGVRNYQARNFMMRDMRVGDGVLFYHSSCAQPGVAGLARVARLAQPDATQFDPASPYYDPKATWEHPRWYGVAVQGVRAVPLLPLSLLRAQGPLQDMPLLARGNRLSITPVTSAQWHHILSLLPDATSG